MTRVELILLKVRDVLADHAGTRWPNATLLRHLTSGVNDFLLRSKVTKTIGIIALEKNIGLYNISAFSQSIDRVQYLDRSLEIKTSKEMDIIDPTWESTLGLEPVYIIFDKLPQGSFRIYPKTEELGLDTSHYNSLYGAIIDITVDESLLRPITLTNIAINTNKYLTITYIKKQGSIEEDTILDLDDMYDDALVYFVSGMALRNDADAQNRAFGAEQLKLYDSILVNAKGNESASNNTISTISTMYKGFL